jgi:hypothetical protein
MEIRYLLINIFSSKTRLLTQEWDMRKWIKTALLIMAISGTTLSAGSANAFWWPFGGWGPWGGGPWSGGPWGRPWGGYPYYGGYYPYGGYPYYGGYYPYGGGYPYYGGGPWYGW